MARTEQETKLAQFDGLLIRRGAQILGLGTAAVASVKLQPERVIHFRHFRRPSPGPSAVQSSTDPPST